MARIPTYYSLCCCEKGPSFGTTLLLVVRWYLFNGLFLRTALVGQHRKGQTILDFNEERDDGVAVA